MIRSVAVKYAIGIVMLLLSTYDHAGTVYFYGAIVEPTCHAKYDNVRLRFDCSLRSDGQGESHILISSSDLEYLNEKRTFAVAHVTYR